MKGREGGRGRKIEKTRQAGSCCHSFEGYRTVASSPLHTHWLVLLTNARKEIRDRRAQTNISLPATPLQCRTFSRGPALSMIALPNCNLAVRLALCLFFSLKSSFEWSARASSPVLSLAQQRLSVCAFSHFSQNFCHSQHLSPLLALPVCFSRGLGQRWSSSGNT